MPPSLSLVKFSQVKNFFRGQFDKLDGKETPKSTETTTATTNLSVTGTSPAPSAANGSAPQSPREKKNRKRKKPASDSSKSPQQPAKVLLVQPFHPLGLLCPHVYKEITPNVNSAASVIPTKVQALSDDRLKTLLVGVLKTQREQLKTLEYVVLSSHDLLRSLLSCELTIASTWRNILQSLCVF